MALNDLVVMLATGKVPLLPTPRASDGTKGSPNQRGSRGDLTLPSLVVRMYLAHLGSTGSSTGQQSSVGKRSSADQHRVPWNQVPESNHDSLPDSSNG